ncbi:MAG: transcriptional regulator, family [Verrucomicrobiaceae bacterium]|nr:transcriptional regulator, family [Verrucomicrobiaceae bacterium]
MSRLDAVTFNRMEDALADSIEEAASWRIRNELMDNIIEAIAARNWTQVEAAKYCGITLPRLMELLKNKVSRFSLDELVNIGVRIGTTLTVKMKHSDDQV